MNLNLQRVEEPFVFKVTNQEGIDTWIDANTAIGGQGKGLRPMELVASGLAGCVAIDVLLIFKKQRISSNDFEIEINAKRKDEVPSPFEHIELIFKLDRAIDKEKLGKNIQLVFDKYCSVAASLDNKINLTYQIK